MLYLNEITPNVEPIIRQFHSGKGDFNAEIAIYKKQLCFSLYSSLY